MAHRWFFAQAGVRTGPFSEQQLKDLAAGGQILTTDTVWQEGTERGAAAHLIKNLFRTTAVLLPLTSQMRAVTPAEVSAPRSAAAAESSATSMVTAAPPPPEPVRPVPAPTPKKGKAKAGKGAVIVSQDGTSVRYRKKCLKCGREDSSARVARIRNGCIRETYFCPTCRKSGPVEIFGNSV